MGKRGGREGTRGEENQGLIGLQPGCRAQAQTVVGGFAPGLLWYAKFMRYAYRGARCVTGGLDGVG